MDEEDHVSPLTRKQRNAETVFQFAQPRHADILVAVSIAGGPITPVQYARGGSLSSIWTATKDLLLPGEYQGGTGQFTAVINSAQSTILAIGAGEQRP